MGKLFNIRGGGAMVVTCIAICAGVALAPLRASAGPWPFDPPPSVADAAGTIDPSVQPSEVAAADVTTPMISVCVGTGVDSAGWVVTTVTSMMDVRTCTDDAAEEALACLERLPDFVGTEEFGKMLAQCLGGQVVDKSELPTNQPGPLYGNDVFGNAPDQSLPADPTKVGGDCKAEGVNPELGAEEPSSVPINTPTGGSDGIVAALKGVIVAIAFDKYMPARTEELLKASDGEAKVDYERLAANNENLLKVTEAVQKDIPAPTSLFDSVVAVAKGVVDAVIDKVTGVSAAPPKGSTKLTNPDAETPCKQAAELVAHCEAVNWVDTECKELQNQMKKCDPYVANSVDGAPCEEEKMEAPENPPSVTCSEIARPIPEGDPCSPPKQEEQPPRPEGENVDPCDGMNPYALTAEEPCPTDGPTRDPVLPVPQPEPEEFAALIGAAIEGAVSVTTATIKTVLGTRPPTCVPTDTVSCITGCKNPPRLLAGDLYAPADRMEGDAASC